jgi:excisionase family DNA binding protein
MEVTEINPNLLSEKQAAKRLGIARITLLRAREAGRIKFFRIGTRVLYSEEQLAEFLLACQKNGGKSNRPSEALPSVAKRKDNQVSSPKRPVRKHQEVTPQVDDDSAQALLPFAVGQ